MSGHSKPMPQPMGVTQAQKILIKALSGAIGAGISSAQLYPFENVKTRLQLIDTTKKGDVEKPTKSSGGLISTAKAIYDEEGLGGFYSGVGPMVVYNVVNWGTFFGILELIKSIFPVETSSQIWWASFVSGQCNVLLTIPLSVISNFVIKHKKDTGQSISMFQAFTKVVCKSGWRGLYGGLLFSLFLVVNPTINMLAYEKIKKVLPGLMNKELALFLSGGLAKLLATIITYPVVTVKVNQQAGSKPSGKVSTQALVFSIYEKYGVPGFYKGLQAKVFHSVFNIAVAFYLNEKINAGVIKAVQGMKQFGLVYTEKFIVAPFELFY